MRSTASTFRAAAERKIAPQIGGIHHIFQHGNAAGIGANRFNRRERPPLHGAEHASCEGKTRESREHIQRGSVDGDIPTAGNDFPCLSLHMFLLHQEGDGAVERVQCAVYHLGALRDEKPVSVLGMQQFPLGQAGINVKCGIGEIPDPYDFRHFSSLKREGKSPPFDRFSGLNQLLRNAMISSMLLPLSAILLMSSSLRDASLMAAWAAARRAMGTRNGLQET